MRVVNAQAIVFVEPGKVELRKVGIPQPGPKEVLVEALYTCISPGTELRCLAAKESKSPRDPYIMGYAFTGRVVEAGAETKFTEGDVIFSQGTERAEGAGIGWGGHTSLAVISEKKLIRIPEGLEPALASTAKLGGIAYHGVRRAQPLPSEHVALIGLGALGQYSARLFQAAGCRVAACDLAESRVEAARKDGIDAFVPGPDMLKDFLKRQPDGADIVIDVTGAPQVLPKAVELAKEIPWDDSNTPGARFMVQGSYPGDFTIPYPPAFARELTFFLPRNVQRQDVEAVLDLIQRKRIHVDPLLSDIRKPEEAQSAYDDLKDPHSGLLTIAFDWTRR